MMRLIWKIREHQVRGEEGFSLLELMMALTILMVGIVAIVGSLAVAVKASGLQRHRLNAVQVANEAMEKIRAQLYFNVAIHPDDPNYDERPESSMVPPPTEVVHATDTIYSIPVAPPSITREGVVFDIRQNVYWISYTDPVTSLGYQRAYKHPVVRVFWRDQVGSHDYMVEADLYPGNLGAQTADWCGEEPSSPVQFPPVAPSDFMAELAPITDQVQAILTWQDNSSDECSFEWAMAMLPSGNSVTSCGNQTQVPEYLWILISPDLPFTTGSTGSTYQGNLTGDKIYCFRLRAKNMIGVSDWAYSNPLITPGSAPGQSCTLGTVLVRSPAYDTGAPMYRVKLKNNNFNQDNVAIGITVSGECSQVWVDIQVTSPTRTIRVPLSQSGNTWSGELPANWEKFNTGNRNWVFGATSVFPPDPPNTTQSVCQYKSAEC